MPLVLNEGMIPSCSHVYQHIYSQYLTLYDTTKPDDHAFHTMKVGFVGQCCTEQCTIYDVRTAIVLSAEDIHLYEESEVAVILPKRSTYPIPMYSTVQYIEFGEIINMHRRFDLVIVNAEGMDRTTRTYESIHREISRTRSGTILIVE